MSRSSSPRMAIVTSSVGTARQLKHVPVVRSVGERTVSATVTV